MEVLGWKPIKSPSADVGMHMKHIPPKKGERNVATGLAVGVIDCSAEGMEEKPAWFDERMRSMIPGDMIPSSDDLNHIAAEGDKGALVKRTLSSSGRRASQSGGRMMSSFDVNIRGVLKANKKKYAKVTPEGGGEVMTEEIAGEFMKMSTGRRGSMRM